MENIMELSHVESTQSVESLLKRCPKCGRELPLSEFNKSKRAKDGLQCHCRECQHESAAISYARLKARRQDNTGTKFASRLSKVYSNPDLATFTPRQLMEELKARGFKWEYMLEPQKKIFYEKI